MRKAKKRIIPLKSTQITAIISVTLVLAILGIVAFLGLLARSASRDVRQQIGFVAVMSDVLTPTELTNFERELKSIKGVKEVKFSSSDEVLARWKELAGEDEDDDELLDFNPFFPEFEVSVFPAYSHPDSLVKITSPLELREEVSEIVVHSDIAHSVNETIKSLTLLLLLIAGGLLIISFILINNTIRLTVYSKRFLIHTMQLVGATGGFIRRPLVVGNFIQGIVSSILAIIILICGLLYLSHLDAELVRAITWRMAWIVFGGLIIAGATICTIAGILSANKYLKSDYDDMF